MTPSPFQKQTNLIESNLNTSMLMKKMSPDLVRGDPQAWLSRNEMSPTVEQDDL